ncbi:MAG: family 16 glycosylhydrolase [Acidobacteriota bacterium]
MKHVLIAALIAAGFSFGSTVKAAEQASEAAQADADTVFIEQFNAPSLDRSVWNVIVTGEVFNNEQQAYIDSTSAISPVNETDAPGAHDGALALTAAYRPGFTTRDGRKFDFTSGRIDTRGKKEFTYGTFSARMKLPAGDGFWPAFWLLGQGRWPDVGEIDIMENVGEADWTSVAIHGPKYSGETPLVNKFFFDGKTDITDWHVYSVEWTKEGMIFRIDGRMIYRATRAMVEHYGRWAFDAPKFIILNLALGGVYPAKTSRIDKPYYGMSASTVETIKNGAGRVLVDWVLVTQPKAR